jgi:hypothetical protein
MITQEVKDKISHLKAEGKKTREIATALNLSMNQVVYWTNGEQREKQKATHRTWFHTNYNNLKVKKLANQREYYRNNKSKVLRSVFFSLLKGHLKRKLITKEEVLLFINNIR